MAMEHHHDRVSQFRCVFPRAVRRPLQSTPPSCWVLQGFGSIDIRSNGKRQENGRIILAQRQRHHFLKKTSNDFYQRQIKYLERITWPRRCSNPIGRWILHGLFQSHRRSTVSHFLGVSAIWSSAADPTPYPTSSELLLTAQLSSSPPSLYGVTVDTWHLETACVRVCVHVKCCPNVWHRRPGFKEQLLWVMITLISGSFFFFFFKVTRYFWPVKTNYPETISSHSKSDILKK